MRRREKAVRILHIVGSMNRGGVETWLMHVMRHIDRDSFAMDFVVHIDEPGAYDEEIRQLGGRIFHCPDPQRPLEYARRFVQIVQAHGPFHVLHSHVHHFSGFPLWLARLLGIPQRIAHSHNDLREHSRRSLARQLYCGLMKALIRSCATAGYACSRDAAISLYGHAWAQDARWRIAPYGIDLDRFGAPADADELRQRLGIAAESFVIGHVGSFTYQKNHELLVQIAAEVCRQQPKAHFLLVGDGELRAVVGEQVQRLGIASRITFAGLRSDVPVLMRDVMDVFLFPSRFEGLGLVLVEAQAAGLPCVYSANIPEEADIVPELLWRVSLEEPAKVWAAAVLGVSRRTSLMRAAALSAVRCSSYDIDKTVVWLSEQYRTHALVAAAEEAVVVRRGEAQ
jgi:glycosyltransferase involved in cell wall biosynthesis